MVVVFSPKRINSSEITDPTEKMDPLSSPELFSGAFTLTFSAFSYSYLLEQRSASFSLLTEQEVNELSLKINGVV